LFQNQKKKSIFVSSITHDLPPPPEETITDEIITIYQIPINLEPATVVLVKPRSTTTTPTKVQHTSATSTTTDLPTNPPTGTTPATAPSKQENDTDSNKLKSSPIKPGFRPPIRKK